MVIGHAGGDPLGHCENTLEATRSALKLGANAIEVDIAISKDDVIFLWHDPNPLGLHSLARRLGFTIKGRCRPSMSINQNARELTWKQIEEFWFYDDLHFAGHRSHIKIPTLKEWFNEFQNDSRLKLIWLDVKANGDSIEAMARSLSEIIPKFLAPKIQFSANADENGVLLQRELSRLGLIGLASRVVVDTVPLSPYIGDVERYNAINKALKMDYISGEQMVCGCCANIGRPLLAFNKWSGLQKLVNFNVAERNLVSKREGNYVSIYVWTIDDPVHMEWLISSGVDGIITNNPKALAEQIVRKRRRKSLS